MEYETALITTQEQPPYAIDPRAKQHHESWLLKRQAEGWRRGAKHDSARKLHPYLCPWNELNLGQQGIISLVFLTILEEKQRYESDNNSATFLPPVESSSTSGANTTTPGESDGGNKRNSIGAKSVRSKRTAKI